MRIPFISPRSCVLLVMALAPAGALAQTGSPDDKKEIELDNLRTPTSPAFTLLGVSPSEVARPSTPRALATDLVSKTNSGSILPGNYALEFAPYWLVPQPTLSYKEYTEPTVAQSIAQSFSVSFATARADSSSDTASTQVALGVRLLPFAGRASSRFRSLERKLDSIQKTRIRLIAAQGDALDDVDAATIDIAELQAQLAATPARDAAKVADIRRRIGAANLRLTSAKSVVKTVETTRQVQGDTMRALAKAMGRADAERVGAFVELAAAASAAYPGTGFDDGKLDRVGAWGTFSYRLESPHVDLIGLLRFLRNLHEEDQNAIDLGARFLWLHNDLGLSAEWVSRTADEVDRTSPLGDSRRRSFTSSSRVVGVIDYRAADAVYLTMSFGRDYKLVATERHPLVASLGVQLLYGDEPVVKLPP